MLPNRNNDNKVWGVILARGGSQRLPHKNMRLLGDKPMIAYSFEAALSAHTLDQTWLYTDDSTVVTLATDQYPKIRVPAFVRPAGLSSPQTSSTDTLRHFCVRQQQAGLELPEFLLLLQPTSPLRMAEDIDAAVNLMLINVDRADCLLSVTKPSKPAEWLLQRKETGLLVENTLPSADWYLPNGAIFITKTENLLTGQEITQGKIVSYEMPLNRSVDIDTLQDFYIAEALLAACQTVSSRL